MTGRPARPTVLLKLGGELLEDPARLSAIAQTVARGAPLVLVHGGGREIDAALKTAGIEKRQVEGLRITDAATLDIVVSVLVGLVNTRLVAAIAAAGGRAVGLTGADGAIGLVEPAPPHRTVDGQHVDLGRVGTPIEGGFGDCPPLLASLIGRGFVPAIASIGLGRDGRLYNVNADTYAAHFAIRLGCARLVIAGATAGVLDRAGRTLATLDLEAVARLVADGSATAGMIAKLQACRLALGRGVGEVVIVDGRDAGALDRAIAEDRPAEKCTRLTARLTDTRLGAYGRP